MTELLWEALRGVGYLVGAIGALLFLLSLWYVTIKLAAFAWSKGRKEAQNPHDRRCDGR